MSKPGIKPVSKGAAGGGGGGPIAGRRATVGARVGGGAGAGAAGAGAGPKGRGLSKAGSDRRSQPALREPAISAQHLLSLLGPSGGAELRGLFSSQDDRQKPLVHPALYEPKQRQSHEGEDIITGAKKRVAGPGQAAAQAPHAHAHQPPHAQPDPYASDASHAYWSHDSAPQAASHYAHPPPPVPSSNYSHYPSAAPSPDLYSHASAAPSHAYPSGSAPGAAGAVAGGVGVPGLSSPVAKNRARAMGSTIFAAGPQEDDLPSNTITGHFRARVPSAAAVAANNRPAPWAHGGAEREQHGSAHAGAGYIAQSSMLNREPRGRPGGVGLHAGPPPQADPYARQAAHPNPYDTRSSPAASHAPSPAPGAQQQYARPLPHSSREAEWDSAAGSGGGAHSPPRSPSSHVPRHSWGGGEASQFEAGSAGAREAARRKQEELRAQLDAQLREKYAGAGGAPPSKSSKYALRHRERQEELRREQMHMPHAGAQPSHYPPPPHDPYAQYPPPPQTYSPSHAHPPQPQAFNFQQPPHPSMSPSAPPAHAHGRYAHDPYAAPMPNVAPMEGLTEKQRAQAELRSQLAAQVAEKERVKAEARARKEEEDRRERARMGIPDSAAAHAPMQPTYPPHDAAYPPQSHLPPQQAGAYGAPMPQQGPYPPHVDPYAAYPSQHYSPPHGHHAHAHGGAPPPPPGSVVSPSKVAENRGRQMQSNIFDGGAESEASKKARERAAAQAALAEQIQARKRAKEEARRAEEEMERRDNERVARERLEMLNRFQGLDPAAAAVKAQQAMDEARAREAAANGAGVGANGVPGLGNSPQQRERALGGGGVAPDAAHAHPHSHPQSPSNAKTIAVVGGRAQQQQQQPSAGGGSEDAYHVLVGGEEVDPDHESRIARLQALTSAMNRKVDARRAAALQMEQSGVLDDDPAGAERNLERFQEVPRRKEGVVEAGRRGGKQGAANKLNGPAGSKKKQAAVNGTRERERSAARKPSASRKRVDESDSDRRRAVSASRKRPSAADRDRDREREVIAAAERRKASILARARREVEAMEQDEAHTDEWASASEGLESEESARHMRRRDGRERQRERERDRRSSSTARQPARSTKTALGGGRRGVPSAPAARSRSRARARFEDEAEDRREDRPIARRPARAASSASVSRASTARRGGRYHDYEEEEEEGVEVERYPYGDEFRGRTPIGVGARGSRIPAPRVQSGQKRTPLREQMRHTPQRGDDRYAHAHSAHALSPHHLSSASYEHNPASRALSPTFLAHGGAYASAGGPPPGAFPWFAHASASGAALDSSLSGNSAFILLPSKSSLLPTSPEGTHAAVAAGGDSNARVESIAAAQASSALLAPSGGDEEGIGSDELERLLTSYGQPLAFDALFDNNLVPSTASQVQRAQSAAAVAQPAAAVAQPARSRQSSARPVSSRPSARVPAMHQPDAATVPPASNRTPRLVHTEQEDEERAVAATLQQEAEIGGSGPTAVDAPLSPGGGSLLEAGSQDWVEGSLLSAAPSTTNLHAPPTATAGVGASSGFASAHTASSSQLTAPQGGLASVPERALSPIAHVLHTSNSRGSLGRPMPRVLDPFAAMPPPDSDTAGM